MEIPRAKSAPHHSQWQASGLRQFSHPLDVPPALKFCSQKCGQTVLRHLQSQYTRAQNQNIGIIVTTGESGFRAVVAVPCRPARTAGRTALSVAARGARGLDGASSESHAVGGVSECMP